MKAKDKKAFRLLDEQRVERIRRETAFEKSQLKEAQRRRKIGERSRQKAFKQHGSEALLEQFTELHATDFASALKSSKALQVQANKLARERKKELRASLKRIRKEKLYEYSRGNPVLTTCISTASRIFITNTDLSPNVTLNPG